jgi:hypothetical protein
MLGDCGVMKEIQLRWKTKDATCLPTATARKKESCAAWSLARQPLSNLRAVGCSCQARKGRKSGCYFSIVIEMLHLCSTPASRTTFVYKRLVAGRRS